MAPVRSCLIDPCASLWARMADLPESVASLAFRTFDLGRCGAGALGQRVTDGLVKLRRDGPDMVDGSAHRRVQCLHDLVFTHDLFSSRTAAGLIVSGGGTVTRMNLSKYLQVVQTP